MNPTGLFLGLGLGSGGRDDMLVWRILGPLFNSISRLFPPLYASVWLPLPAPPSQSSLLLLPLPAPEEPEPVAERGNHSFFAFWD